MSDYRLIEMDEDAEYRLNAKTTLYFDKFLQKMEIYTNETYKLDLIRMRELSIFSEEIKKAFPAEKLVKIITDAIDDLTKNGEWKTLLEYMKFLTKLTMTPKVESSVLTREFKQVNNNILNLSKEFTQEDMDKFRKDEALRKRKLDV